MFRNVTEALFCNGENNIYETYHNDPPDGYGGLLISIKPDLLGQEVSNNLKSELVAAKIKLANDKWLICSGYRLSH